MTYQLEKLLQWHLDYQHLENKSKKGKEHEKRRMSETDQRLDDSDS